jgi:endonuclease I
MKNRLNPGDVFDCRKKGDFRTALICVNYPRRDRADVTSPGTFPKTFRSKLMLDLRTCALSGRLACVCAVFALSSVVRADTYDAPASYYSAATGTGTTLKTNLYNIVRTGFVGRDYGASRYAPAILDADPNQAGRVILIYNRASVSSTWDSGNTWNREHIWPASLLGQSSPGNTYTGPASDLFELRPSNPTINSDRGNDPFGKWDVTAPASGYGAVSGGYYNPGPSDRGDVSRTLFYMATRYGQGQTNNLSLVNGSTPSTYQMGDLASLLRWHYQDPVDAFERRRNHLIYSQADNPTYYQGNRNPYIDRPEYVWAVFGGGVNNSQLAVALPSTDGSSARTVDLGSVIAGSSFGTQAVTLNKSGVHPTTFDATLTGNATSTLVGPRMTFDYNAGSKNLTVGLSGSTSTVGLRTGGITFDNTDLTTGGAGLGSADGNDVVNVTGRVVSHAVPSLALTSTLLSQTIDYGIVAQDASLTVGFSVVNRDLNGGFTAGLDIDAINTAGDAAAFAISAGPSTNLLAGGVIDFAGSLLTDTLGTKSATYALLTSDQNIPGATNLATLNVSLTARIALGGDASLDELVNFNDLLILAQNYQNGATTWQTGDFNRDGITDFGDLLLLAQNYGGGGALSGLDALSALDASFAADWSLAQSLLPEPACLSLIGLTLIGRRRRA